MGYLILTTTIIFITLYLIGRQIALRDKLSEVDAIVCLAGTRGNIDTLHEKIDSAIELYNKGFARKIIMSGKFSKKVSDNFEQFNLSEIKKYADEGRITKDHINFAFNHWDLNLGADYMKDYATQKGLPEDHVIVEDKSLHTRENAKYTLLILKKHQFKSIILVTSPFHQRRAFEAFSKILKPSGIKVINYAANSKQWNNLFWFLSINNIKLVFKELARMFQYRVPA